jgi:hypothetical protein
MSREKGSEKSAQNLLKEIADELENQQQWPQLLERALFDVIFLHIGWGAITLTAPVVLLADEFHQFPRRVENQMKLFRPRFGEILRIVDRHFV